MKLKFAYKARSIEYVYKVGPHSCMKGSKRVRAYEGPDLAVAYIRHNKQIVARAVVWPKKKQYWTVYAIPQQYKYDYSRSDGFGFANRVPTGNDYFKDMRDALHKAGYKCRRLKGARLAKIPAMKGDKRHYKGYMVPSVDGRRGLEIGTKYIKIT